MADDNISAVVFNIVPCIAAGNVSKTLETELGFAMASFRRALVSGIVNEHDDKILARESE